MMSTERASVRLGEVNKKKNRFLNTSSALLESWAACWLKGVGGFGMQREVWEASKAGRIIRVGGFSSIEIMIARLHSRQL